MKADLLVCGAPLLAAGAKSQMGHRRQGPRWLGGNPEPLRSWESQHLRPSVRHRLQGLGKYMSDAPSVARESTGKRIVSGPAERTPRIWESRIEDALAIWLAAEMHRLVRGWGNPPAVILNTLERQCWNLVDPDRPEPATEDEVALALRLTREAIQLTSDDPALQDTHAWALFANGLHDEALLASRRALELADEDQKSDFQGYLNRLQRAVPQEQATDDD